MNTNPIIHATKAIAFSIADFLREAFASVRWSERYVA
jgi:hypothetical protein